MELSTTIRTGLKNKLAQKQINGVARETMQAAGEFWLLSILPKHFTHRGATEYGYAPRSRKYEQIKLRRFGHTYPLVFTGESRDRTKSAAVRATATSKGSRVVVRINAPRLNFRNPHSHINPRDELTRVSVTDHQLIGDIVRRLYHVKLQDVQGQQTTQH